MGLVGKSCPKALAQNESAAKMLASFFIIMIVLVRVRGPAMRMSVAMIVVMHQLLRHVGKHFAGRGRRPADPLDAALLARRRKQVVAGKLRRVPRNLEALGKGGKDKFPHAPSIPAIAQHR